MYDLKNYNVVYKSIGFNKEINDFMTSGYYVLNLEKLNINKLDILIEKMKGKDGRCIFTFAYHTKRISAHEIFDFFKNTLKFKYETSEQKESLLINIINNKDKINLINIDIKKMGTNNFTKSSLKIQNKQLIETNVIGDYKRIVTTKGSEKDIISGLYYFKSKITNKIINGAGVDVNFYKVKNDFWRIQTNYKDGKKDGSIEYWKNEKLYCSGAIKLGLKIGIWKYYDLEGKINEAINFDKKVPAVK